MVARIKKATAPGRDNPLLERLQIVASQVGCVGFTVSKEGLAAINNELDEKGRLFGLAVFCVVPQRERARAYWSNEDLDNYLAKYRLKR